MGKKLQLSCADATLCAWECSDSLYNSPASTVMSSYSLRQVEVQVFSVRSGVTHLRVQ
jgi:hypothetical protein